MGFISENAAIVVGGFIRAMLWGFYSGMLLATLWSNSLQSGSRFWSPVVTAMLLLYAFNIIITAANIGRCYDILFQGGSHQDIYIMLDDAVTFAAVLTADVLISWRCFLIMSRDRRVGFLTILGLSTGSVTGVAVIVYDVLYCIQDKVAYDRPYFVWSVASYACTLSYNWAVTGLVIWRIRQAAGEFEMETQPTSRRRPYHQIIVALAQGGGLYSIALGAFLIVYVSSGHFALLLRPSLSVIVGIVPILVQATLRPQHTSGMEPSNPTDFSTAIRFAASCPTLRNATSTVVYGP